jgi:hypothetical protein
MQTMFVVLLLLSVSSEGLSQRVTVVEAEKLEKSQLLHTYFKSKDTKKEDRSVEASAIEGIEPGKLLVADDKPYLNSDGRWRPPKLLVVNRENGEEINTLEFDDITDMPDWEAMAQDGADTYYVTGSHGPLIKFRLNNGVIDKKSVAKLNIWSDLKQKGESDLTQIEGLTVIPSSDSTKDSILIVGLRKSGGQVEIYRAELPRSPEQNQALKLIKTYQFAAGKDVKNNADMHLSSLEYVVAWKALLILTSAEVEATNALHGNALWFLPVTPEDLKVDNFRLVEPKKVLEFEVGRKAEGICVISEEQVANAQTRKAQVAVVYDNDIQRISENHPSSFQLLNLIYEPESKELTQPRRKVKPAAYLRKRVQ